MTQVVLALVWVERFSMGWLNEDVYGYTAVFLMLAGVI